MSILGEEKSPLDDDVQWFLPSSSKKIVRYEEMLETLPNEEMMRIYRLYSDCSQAKVHHLMTAPCPYCGFGET